MLFKNPGEMYVCAFLIMRTVSMLELGAVPRVWGQGGRGRCLRPRLSRFPDPPSEGFGFSAAMGSGPLGRPTRPGPYVVGGGRKAVPLTPDNKSEEVAKAVAVCNQGVYVVELAGRRFYVGQSNNISRRMQQHEGKREGGSAWCAEHKFVGRVAPLTPAQPDLESWERAETLAQMHRHGIDAVRGWMYVSVELTQAQREHVFQQVCEKFNLCRSCGGTGHFVSACRVKGRAFWYTRSKGGPVCI